MINLIENLKLYVLCTLCGIFLGLAIFVTSDSVYSREILLTIDSSLEVTPDALVDNLTVMNESDDSEMEYLKLHIRETLKNNRPKKSAGIIIFKITASSNAILNELDDYFNSLVKQYLDSVRRHKITTLQKRTLLTDEIRSALEKQSKASSINVVSLSGLDQYVNSKIQLMELQMLKTPYRYLNNQPSTKNKKYSLIYSVSISIMFFLFLGYLFTVLRNFSKKY